LKVVHKRFGHQRLTHGATHVLDEELAIPGNTPRQRWAKVWSVQVCLQRLRRAVSNRVAPVIAPIVSVVRCTLLATLGVAPLPRESEVAPEAQLEREDQSPQVGVGTREFVVAVDIRVAIESVDVALVVAE
jgi:hypothetical protein